MKGKRVVGLALALVLCLALAACGGRMEMLGDTVASGGMNGTTTAPSSPDAAEGWGFDSSNVDQVYWAENDFSSMEVESSTGSVYQNTSAKLIYRASLSVQTEQFDQAVEQLRNLVERLGGYFQQSQTYGGSYYNRDARRLGSFTIRVPSEQYKAFLSQAGDVGYVTSMNESSDNVGETYFDLEVRLATQRTKQERLLDLLSRAESMEDIILLENALSEVEYQIEQYSSNLNRYDSLIGYATIELDLQEVVRIVEEPGQTDSLLQRLAAGVSSSASNLAQGFQDLLIWLSYNLFAVLLFAVLAAALVVVLRRKKPFARLRKKDPPDQA